jgi:hypothetical protein
VGDAARAGGGGGGGASRLVVCNWLGGVGGKGGVPGKE